CNFDKEIMDTKDYLNTLKDRIQKTHMELEDVKEFFKFNSFEDLKNVVLLHLSNTNSNEEKFKNTFDKLLPLSNIYIADIGLEVNLDLYQF
ncbi:MAG TPA: MBL fold metallo-hydrolase, partial [Clostridiales bacterium]|nr:MBL fold metallo-hydrolase [Clostridiales bacterium]